MKVRFRTNLGTRDANRLGLDSEKCTVGSEVAVSESVAEVVVREGLAEKLAEKKSVKAVPPKAVVSKPKTPEIGKPEEKE